MSIGQERAADATVRRADEHVGFLVVGSPRSGTTLVQRLACEVPGVRMPPETHFFSQFAAGLLKRRTFPLGRDELGDEISRFGALETSRGLEVDAGGIAEDLGGTCPGPFALFDALVRQLSGPARIWGEKTPDHLLWWRPIARSAPWLRFVVVVRDPRAVVASNLVMPWSADRRLPAWGDKLHLALAVHWAVMQRQADAMRRELGPGRCLVLRYEDVVADPGRARRQMAEFLGTAASTTRGGASDGFVHEWEPWKREALGAVDPARVDHWREVLDDGRARQIGAVCRAGMRRFGYGKDAPDTVETIAVLGGLGPRMWSRLLRYGRTYEGYVRPADCLPG